MKLLKFHVPNVPQMLLALFSMYSGPQCPPVRRFWKISADLLSSLLEKDIPISSALFLLRDESSFNLNPLHKKLLLACPTAVKKTVLKLHIKPIPSLNSVFLCFFVDILLLERDTARLPHAKATTVAFMSKVIDFIVCIS